MPSQSIVQRQNFSHGTFAAFHAHLMPADLVKAHDALDRAVDACYRKQPFTSEMERVQFLFKLYEQKTAPLSSIAAKTTRTRKTMPL